MPQVQHGSKALPRNGSGVYSLPGTYEATTGTTILAAQHNDPLEDLQTDMNTARPIVAGGTGGTSAVAANDALNTTANNIASAATVDLSTATGVVVNITGTTTITALGTVASGAERVLIFAGALTLTHNATSLILPGGANIATAAGDVAHMRSLGSGNWKCVGYTTASGSLTLRSSDAGATGPTLELYHDSASPAAADEIGKIPFYGNDDAATKTEYARIRAFISDTTNGSEYGYLSFATRKGGTLAEIMTLNPNAVTFTPSSTFSVFNTNSDANALVFMGGNTGSTGGQVIAWGQSHATDASDVAIFSGGVAKYRYDASASTHKFTDPVESGTFSLTGASLGVQLLASSGRISMSTTGTAASFPAAFYNANGQVGSISTSGSATAFNTSSDQRLKKNFRAPPAAGSRIDQIKIHEFDWKGGGVGVGPKAQELHEIFPEAVTPGSGNPGDPDFSPWMWDASKLVPYLVLEIQSLRKRVAALEPA